MFCLSIGVRETMCESVLRMCPVVMTRRTLGSDYDNEMSAAWKKNTAYDQERGLLTA